MNHNEYEKMPKGFKSYGFDEKQSRELSRLKWVVTEKVHGANFSFVYENRQLKYAKRKDYLSWDDDFFGFQQVVNQLEGAILGLFEQISLDIPADKFMLYGELFGGKYPHPDVAPDENLQAIQTGVYYAPGIHFCAFDMAYEAAETKTYVDYDKAMAYFEAFGIFYAQNLFSGKLNEALEFNTRIPSGIPRQLGLPELDENLIEGVVIKPLNHSSLTTIDQRPIIKVKNAEFEEEKFHEAEKWSFIPTITSQSEELSFIVDEMRNYITHNRLESVSSKIGSIDFANEKRMAEFKTEFFQDIWTDFGINNSGFLEELTASQKDWISSRIKAAVNAFLINFQDQNH